MHSSSKIVFLCLATALTRVNALPTAEPLLNFEVTQSLEAAQLEDRGAAELASRAATITVSSDTGKVAVSPDPKPVTTTDVDGGVDLAHAVETIIDSVLSIINKLTGQDIAVCPPLPPILPTCFPNQTFPIYYINYKL